MDDEHAQQEQEGEIETEQAGVEADAAEAEATDTADPTEAEGEAVEEPGETPEEPKETEELGEAAEVPGVAAKETEEGEEEPEDAGEEAGEATENAGDAEEEAGEVKKEAADETEGVKAEEEDTGAQKQEQRKAGSAPPKQDAIDASEEREEAEEKEEVEEEVEEETERQLSQEQTNEVDVEEAKATEDAEAATEFPEAEATVVEDAADGATSVEPPTAEGTQDGGQEMQPVAPAPTQANLQKLATVKMVLMPSEQVLTEAMALLSTIGQVKSHVNEKTKCEMEQMIVLFNGKEVQDHFAIADFGVDANESIAFEIQSRDPANHPLRLSAPRPPVSGDVITIRVPTPNGTVKEVNVEIEKQQARKKPFLGGYRHKTTNVEYHHAQTQTNPKPKPPSLVPVFNRDTQTVESKHETQQTSNETSTQMTRPGVYVTSVEDKLVVPGRYESAEAYQSRMLAKIVTIQTYYRRWLAKQYVVRLKTERDARLEWEREEEIRKRKEKEDRARREFERRMNPKTKEDFDLLYSTLERWRQEELERINATLTGAERKAALCQLLDQETELIAAVDRHQLDSSKESKEKAVQNLLKKAAAPKKWRNSEGQLMEMDTPFTLRGRELLGIYNSLQMKYLTQDERLDVLLTLKHTVKEHECKLTSELIELIDREADLLIRGVAEEKLAGLRKRISTLFLQYCKTPTFNPEITDLLPVPQDPSQLKNNIHYCSSCGRYLKSTEFPLGVKSTNIGKCRRCLSKDNAARARQDQSAYKRMLWFLRKKESGEALLIEEADLKYLVSNIWEGQSIISCWDDLADLELARWDMTKPWSPTNCIMLTKDEAEAHEGLTDLTKAYGNMLVHRVKQKHVLAKNYFHSITSAAEKMRQRELELRNVRVTTK